MIDLDKQIEDLTNSLNDYIPNSIRQNLVKEEIQLLKKINLLERARFVSSEEKLLNFPVFEVYIVDHCNLNCAYCSHFSPLAKPHFYDTEQFKKDIQRIKYLFDKENIQFGINIMGGEPTLHPDLINILDCSSDYCKTEITTNGLILNKQLNKKDYSLIECIKRNNIKLSITEYTDFIDYSELENNLKELNINYNIVSDRKKMRLYPINIEGNTDSISEFLSTTLCNSCVALRDSVFYSCPIQANVNSFIEYFNLENKMKDANNCGINIYDVDSIKDIYDVISKPCVTCKYCLCSNYSSGNLHYDWKISNKSLDEWTIKDIKPLSLDTEPFSIKKYFNRYNL